jgi:predicted nucleic acid-binding Zn ribbon protein
MHTSMLTAVVVCVLAHGKERCAQEARDTEKEKKRRRSRKISSLLFLLLVYILPALDSIKIEKKEGE